MVHVFGGKVCTGSTHMAKCFVAAVDMRRRLMLAEDDPEDEEAFLEADVARLLCVMKLESLSMISLLHLQYILHKNIGGIRIVCLSAVQWRGGRRGKRKVLARIIISVLYILTCCSTCIYSYVPVLRPGFYIVHSVYFKLYI